MKIPRLIAIVAMVGHVTCLAQTADNWVLQGRAFLAAKNITNANASFAAAVQKAPNHETANALYGSTRLLSLPYTQPWQDMMDRLGLPLTNRSIYKWTAGPPRDTNGLPIPPNDFNAMEFVAFTRTNLAPEISSSLVNLAQVTDANFILNLASNETTISQVTMDYGDIQMLRALLSTAQFIIYTINSYNFSAQLNALYNLHARGEFTLERVVADYPQILTFANQEDLNLAVDAFGNAVDSYLAASQFIRARPTNIVRLFNYDPDTADREARFRQTLAELKASLNGPVDLTYVTNKAGHISVNLERVFDGSEAPRSMLPAFQNGGILLGSLPDPTFNGTVFGFSESDIYRFLGSREPLLSNFRTVHRLPDGRLQLDLNAADGRNYAIEVSTNLVTWVQIAATTSTNGVLTFFDAQNVQLPRRFYRARDLSAHAPGGGITGDPLQMPFVAVSDEGNLPDLVSMEDDGTSGYGAVGYTFWIGKYEVSNVEYAAFLNSAAKTDPHGVFNDMMASSKFGGIVRTGTDGRYSYVVKSRQAGYDADYSGKPVVFVSLYDCLRFCNWLHNGAHDDSSTEDGAYNLKAGYKENAIIPRSADARYFLVNENEWYKAAYYKHGYSFGGYWLYPTRTDEAPTATAGIPTASENSVNCANATPTSLAVGFLTDVGSYPNSASPYGTFDQGGNVLERLENGIVRGGDYENAVEVVRSVRRLVQWNTPLAETYEAGFRIGTRTGPPPSPPAPSIIGQPASQTVTEGGKAILTVVAIGAMPLSYKWQFNEHELFDNMRLSGTHGSSLQIANVQPSDAGSYSVGVSNSVGTITSQVARLKVQSTTPTLPDPSKFIWLPPGTFLMGSPSSEVLRGSDETEHTVTLTKGFFIGKYEVTQREYLSVIGDNPTYFTPARGFVQDLSRPVDSVNWHAATNYCAQLTQREQGAGHLPAGWVYRLPTEAEWEYACRASTTTPFHYGQNLRSGMANFDGRYEYVGGTGTLANPSGKFLDQTTTVGSYQPNAFGLYDMHGNVHEWCQDRYGNYPTGSVIDPQGPATGQYRVFRGGDYIKLAWSCRSAERQFDIPEVGNSIFGFRVVLAPAQP